ncbi:hypothetical protein XHC_1261 [Xanthomonas hortorum pv. carotae str. M081]|nr:hypothetical protein XHC_1261 [Xanthomonas hortorum pv. carotae str. M081]
MWSDSALQCAPKQVGVWINPADAGFPLLQRQAVFAAWPAVRDRLIERAGSRSDHIRT